MNLNPTLRAATRLITAALGTAAIALASTGARAAAPAVPDAPKVPDGLEKKVKVALGVFKTMQKECRGGGGRNPEPYDDELCPKLAARLVQLGEATVHAYGQFYVETGKALPDSESESSIHKALKRSRQSAVVIYGLRYLNKAAASKAYPADFLPTERLLAFVTGWNATAPAPWVDPVTQQYRRSTADAWLRWYAAHGQETYEQWRKGGLEAMRKDLSSADIAVRWSAINVLINQTADRPLALSSLRAVLKDPRLPNEAAYEFAHMAKLAGISPEDILSAKHARKAARKSGGGVATKSVETVTPDQKAARAIALVRQCDREFDRMQVDRAKARCAKALELDPGNVQAKLSMAWVQLETGDMKAFNNAVSVIPYNEVYYGRVLLLQAAGHLVQGKPDFAQMSLVEAASFGHAASPARARLQLLAGKAPSRAFMNHIAPRYQCWKGKSEDEANKFLVRRGLPDPKVFLTTLERATPKERAKWDKAQLKVCPWGGNVGQVK